MVIQAKITNHKRETLKGSDFELRCSDISLAKSRGTDPAKEKNLHRSLEMRKNTLVEGVSSGCKSVDF
jgi:hypothetical protein